MPGIARVIARALVWYAVAVPTCLYAARRGGGPERAVAALVIAASVATMLVPSEPGVTYLTVVWPLLAVDVVMLAGLMAVALAADRYWPIHFAAVHLLSVLLHGVRAYDPTILPGVYARLGGELGYVTLAILAAGTWRHVRRGGDVDWTWQVHGRP